MEIHHPEIHHHRSNNNNTSNYCRSSSLNMHVATSMSHHHHHHHWGQPLRSANIQAGTITSGDENKKRDFHFQVIEVSSGPKWFIWPSQKSTEHLQSDSECPSKSSSNQENENHYHKNGAITPNVVQPNAPMTINVAHLQRKNRLSRRKQLADMHHCSVIDGAMVHVTATNSSSDTTLSEPTQRRLLSKPIICVTETQEQPQCSSSMPSQTFKILSVSKKSWESDDEDVIECACRKMSLSLDDDCPIPSQAHCAAVSGSSIGSYFSTVSTSSTSTSTSGRASDDSGVGGGNNNYD